MRPPPTHSYADKLMVAADAAGYGFCLSLGVFDANDAILNGTEAWVHNPTAWNGTGQPDVVEVDFHYARMPDEGKPALCSTWNGQAWVAGKTEWPGTVATPVTLDPMEVQVREWGHSWCMPPWKLSQWFRAWPCTTAAPLSQPHSLATADLCGQSLCQPVVCRSHPDCRYQVRRPGCQPSSHEHSLQMPWGRQVGLAVHPRRMAI